MATLDDVRAAYLEAMAKLAEGMVEGNYSTTDFEAFLKAKEALQHAAKIYIEENE